MDISVFDLFKIGIGPSSSHTVGPMVAARRFLVECDVLLEHAVAVEVDLYGSLALTGAGHATDKAVILGLMGETPQGVDPELVEKRLAKVAMSSVINLLGVKPVRFKAADHLMWHRASTLPEHPNGMCFTLRLSNGSAIQRVCYSVGGGFIHAAGQAQGRKRAGGTRAVIAFPFANMAQLLAHGRATGKSIADMLRQNELACLSEGELHAGLDRIWNVMRDCIAPGLATGGHCRADPWRLRSSLRPAERETPGRRFVEAGATGENCRLARPRHAA